MNTNLNSAISAESSKNLSVFANLGTIIQIIDANNVILVLYDNGLCYYLNHTSNNSYLKILNKNSNERIGYMFWNYQENELYALYRNNYGISCDLIKLNPNFSIDEDQKNLILFTKRLFQENELEFIESDFYNSSFFIKSYENLKVYNRKGEFFNIRINPSTHSLMKFSNNYIFLFENIVISSYPFMPFNVYNYEGKFVKNFEIVLKKGFAVEIIDVHEDFLLFKQFKDELIILDLKTGSFFESKGFVTPKSIDYIKLENEKNYIICFYAFGIHVWNFKAKKIKEFKFQLYKEDVFYINRVNFFLVSVKLNEQRNQTKYNPRKRVLSFVVISLIDLAQIADIPTDFKNIDLVNFSESYSVFYYSEEANKLNHFSIINCI